MSDAEFLCSVDGLFVGQLDDAELERFGRLIDEGMACRSYEGVSGLMGLAKVRTQARAAVAAAAAAEGGD